MKLHETLNICLLALESRYPECVVEVNESLPGNPGYWGEACLPDEMLEVLRLRDPDLLETPAHLVIEPEQSAIYLVDRSEVEPAFWIYCGGCTPAQRARQQAKRLMPV